MFAGYKSDYRINHVSMGDGEPGREIQFHHVAFRRLVETFSMFEAANSSGKIIRFEKFIIQTDGVTLLEILGFS